MNFKAPIMLYAINSIYYYDIIHILHCYCSKALTKQVIA